MFIEGKISVQTSVLDKTVFTDVKWTDFILGQILMNSVKYRSDLPKIEIYGLQSENNVTLVIADNGIGIPKKILAGCLKKGLPERTADRQQSQRALAFICAKAV